MGLEEEYLGTDMKLESIMEHASKSIPDWWERCNNAFKALSTNDKPIELLSIAELNEIVSKELTKIKEEIK